MQDFELTGNLQLWKAMGQKKTKSEFSFKFTDIGMGDVQNPRRPKHTYSNSHARAYKSCYASPRNKKPLEKRQVIEKYDLCQFELNELERINEIYYLGFHRSINKDYLDDRSGAYLVYLDDHLLYRYQILGFLGEGSFGTVVKCLDHKTSSLVAVKILKNDPVFLEYGKNENDFLNQLSSDSCIVDKISDFEFRGHFCLVFELLSIDLYQFLKASNFRGLHHQFVKRVVVQVLIALKESHALGIVHCDVKPENIVLRNENKSKIKLIDFGSAWKQGLKKFDYIQSRYYRAPEVVLESGWSEKIDVWSLGCLIVELLIGRPLFMAATEVGLLVQQISILGPMPRSFFNSGKKSDLLSFESLHKSQVMSIHKYRSLEGILQDQPGNLIDFVKSCLNWNPDKRPSAQEALRHKWIRSLHNSN